MTTQELVLIDPDETLRDQFLAMAAENAAVNDHHYSADYQETLHKAEADFAAYVRLLHDQSLGVDLPPGHVPQNTYWLLRPGDRRLLGASRLRHRLTTELEHEGGHIGYDIRATERRRGYGSCILAFTLEKARAIGLSRVLVMCFTANVASARIILKNGGKLWDETTAPSGDPLSRYWIELDG